MTVPPPNALRDVLQTESWAQLTNAERAAIADAIGGVRFARDTNREFLASRSTGERWADLIAKWVGSWAFIIGFGIFLAVWVLVNTVLFARQSAPDPFPYIFLNLLLSMLAAIQAPLIMMSQNRMAQKDRLDAAVDFEVNRQSELEVRAVHEKLDAVVAVDWPRLIALQEAQLDLLRRLDRTPDAPQA